MRRHNRTIGRISGLAKRFGEIEALSDVDLRIDGGIIHALVGPDGAGKTTLIRILAGIMTPNSGEIDLLGCDVARDPESVKGKIGYLSQRFSLNPVLTVKENIEFFASLYRVPRAEKNSRLSRLLEFSRLAPFSNRQAAHLSGGMKQKLSLCCALIHTPELLLLDEPTTGVDPISRRELWEILYDLVGEGVTVLVSTPYMDEAERAGEITLLHKGRTITSGTLDELRSRYKYALYECVCADNQRAFTVASDRLGKDRVMLFGDKLHLALDNKEDAVSIERCLSDEGIAVGDYRKIDPGLEDIFIQELSVE